MKAAAPRLDAAAAGRATAVARATPARAVDAAAPGAIVGPYRLGERLGSGGMGTVFAAEHVLLGRAAAVKVLRSDVPHGEDEVARFFNEARAATAIRHPGIIEVFDFGYRADGAAFIVMELLDGESLAARLERGPLAPDVALALTRQIAGALAAAHERGIVHRDLKPDNVFLVVDPEVPGGERIKLLDFGIAKLTGEGRAGPHTGTGMVLGTPAYMAPEQCRGLVVDERADLYALGCLLFEMCTGRPPFVGAGPGDLLAAHIHLAPPTLRSVRPEVGSAIDGLAQALLAKAREDRPASADEVIDAIDRLGARSARSARPARSAWPARSRRRGGAHVGVGLVGALVAAIAAAALVASSGREVEAMAEVTSAAPPVREPEAAPAPAMASEPPPAMAPVATRAPAPSRSTSLEVAPVTAPVAAEIDVAVRSTPPGATVLLDGAPAGVTPLVVRRPPSERLAVGLRLRRHRDERRVVDGRAAVALDVDLARRRAPRSPPGDAHDRSVNPFAP